MHMQVSKVLEVPVIMVKHMALLFMHVCMRVFGNYDKLLITVLSVSASAGSWPFRCSLQWMKSNGLNVLC